MCEQVVDEIRSSNPARKILVERGADLVITGNCSAIGPVISNLVGNAVQYGDQRTIEIQTYATTTQVIITVRNFGPAIPDAQIATMFNGFTRGDTNTAGTMAPPRVLDWA
jgi:two-component system sensor histidine kinase MtrB